MTARQHRRRPDVRSAAANPATRSWPARASALARGAGALLALAAFTVGVPAALLALGADPRTAHLPTITHLRELLLRRDDGTVLLTALRAAAWAGWTLFTLTVLAETATAVTGRTSRLLPALRPIRQPAALLVAAVATALTTPTGALTAARPAAVTAAVLTPPRARPQPTQPAPVAPRAAARPAPWAAGPLTGSAPGVQVRQLPQVTVGRYDSLWRLAERHLGTGHRWTDIYQLNAGRPQPDGRALTQPDRLEPGWVLLLPSNTAHPTAGPEPTDGRTVTVQAGDTLSSIAQRQLGDAQAWPAIYAANTGRPQHDGGRLTDPDLIRPGWTLLLPTSPPPTSPAATGGPVYQVAPGDQLGAIAQRFLGDWHRYRDIAALNPTLIPDPTGPHGPDHIGPDWQLHLPADAHDRGPRPHATGQTLPPVAAGPRPTQPAPPRRPPPQAPATTPQLPVPPTPPVSPPPATTAPATPSGASPASTRTPAPAQQHGPGVGVDLPSGWVTLPLAAALAAAGSLVWLHRRRRYTPGPVTRPAADDPDLRPLPPAVAILRRGVRDHSPPVTDDTPDQPTVAEAARTSRPVTVPPIGPNGPDLAGLTDLMPPGGLGLTGPGADAAARGLLIATLATGSPTDPDARGHVLIPAATLTTLLQTAPDNLPPTPRLHIAPTLDDALATLDETLLERRRLLDEHHAADLAELHATDPYHPTIPPLLLIAGTPPPDQHPRLTAALQQGAPLQITAALLGSWPAGTATIDTDGHLTDHPTDTDAEEPPRLGVLDVSTTRQLLDVLHEAHTGQPPDRPEAAPEVPATTPAPPAAPTPPPPPAHLPVSVTVSTRQPATGRVGIRMLGPPAVLDADSNPVPGLRHHATGLLAYLTIHRAGAKLPDIMEAFWPTATIRRASERLSTEAANLRRTIRRAAGDTSLQPLINTGGRYHLNPELLDIDTWNLTDTLARASTDPTAHTDELRAAVDTSTAPLAAGCDYEWLEPHRETYRRHAINARLQLATLVAETDPDQAADLAQAAADLDPYNEDLTRRAMRAVAHAGHPDRIPQQLSRLRTALADIDEEPTPETLTLARTLQDEHHHRAKSTPGDQIASTG